MKMHSMKYESFIVVFFLVFVSDISCQIWLSQERATKVLNETFFVVCKDGGGRPVTWKGPKGPLGVKTRPTVQTSSYGKIMLFNQTTLEDAGTYTCLVNEEKREFHLSIENPLTFMDTSADQTGMEGKDVTLRCEVRGGKITWSVEGGDISDRSKFEIMGDGLLIKNVQRTDSKTYICKAVQQTTGMVVDRRIKLRVLHKPTFPHPVYAKQEQAYGYINGTVNLTCIMVAEPPPKFEWVKNQDRIEKIGRVFNVSPEVSVLQLHIERSSFGNYKCVASNQYGKLEKYFSLDEGTKPYPPKFIELKGTNSDFLDLGIHGPTKAEIEPGMETKGFSVQFKETKKGGGWSNKDFNISEDNSYLLVDLLAKTEYDVRAATRNAAGLSDYTNVSIFETLPAKASSVSGFVALNLFTTVALTYIMNIWTF